MRSTNKLIAFTTRLYTGINLILLSSFLIIFAPFWLFFLSIGILFYMCLTEWPQLFSNQKILNSARYFLFFLGSTIFYLLIPFFMIGYLQYKGFWKVNLLLFGSVSFFDTFSYLGGIFFGQNRLCPKISPKKTWEGFLAGLVSTLILFYFLGYFYKATTIFFALAICTTLLALAGDLFESWLKRTQKIKDTGSFLPGHGGLLDRLDSILSTTWVFFFIRNYLIAIL